MLARSLFRFASLLVFLGVATPVASQEWLPSAVGLERGLEVRVATRTTDDGKVLAAIDPGLLLELSPRSVRAPGFRLLVQGADGRITAVAPGPVRTLRGRVVNMPGSAVAGAVLEDGLHARLMTADGEEYWLQPVTRLPGTPSDLHLLYRSTDVISTRLGCGTDLLANARPSARVAPAPGGAQPREMAQVAELACDADFEFVTRYGGATQAAMRIELVIGMMNAQYERDVNITHQITSIVARTSANQPYTSTDAVALLNQFRDHWNANHTTIARDTAQLFTGKEINGGTIGIAWIGVVCDLQWAYSVVQSDFNNNLGCATDLSAHELGHNWNADHCGCNNYTMNRFITCANRFHPRQSIPEISAFRDSRSCLGTGGGGVATSVAASVVASTSNQGQGNKAGRAVVTVTDDLGAPVQGATVTGDFTGTFAEPGFTGMTGADGTVTFVTSNTARGGVSVTFCVTDVTAPLTWSQAPGPVCGSN